MMADDGTAASSSSSLSSLSEGMYDVFVSFTGEDTRYTFTDYLYHTLAVNGKLKVFRDDPDLKLSDPIKPTLMEAIKRSRVFIVVMSPNYVSSSWCLLELVEMLKYSTNGRNRPVFPVFYHVEPSEVRYQNSDKSKRAMRKHEERYGKDTVAAWKLALSTVCGLSGQHIVENKGYETKVIGEIAEQVFGKHGEIKQLLNSFDSQFEKVQSLLDLESRNTLRVVGIYEEDAKINETTFAFELYYKIKYEFWAASFLVNVSKQLRENADNRFDNLQKELLSDMGVETMQELEHKRVLLVLDDVDSKKHLELLARCGDWFGPGSRIIITTKNKDVLENSPVMNGVELQTHCIREGEFVGSNRNVKEKRVVGFVKDFTDVINQLKEEDSTRSVVSIVDMGGSGKTTLAGKIYDSKEVRELFPCHAWAIVSKDYRENEVFSSLHRCLMPFAPIPENKEELKLGVRRCLNEQRRKYLVVLDDVWDTQAWDKLKDYVIPNKNNGSRILVTTRNAQVANYARSKEPHHEPSRLNEEESWELFCSEVFRGEECPPDLEPIGKSIAKSCKGLPLPIVTIARVVAKRNRSKTEWKSIENLIPYWFDDKDIDGMMKILKMSYDDLPQKLKPCFLYLGVFPEDYRIKARELIKLWIAEGFIQVREIGTSKQPPRPEVIGEKFLMDLLDRNLVQVTERKSDGEGVKICQIHDLFRDLCIKESNSRRLSFIRKGKSYACSVKCNQSSICSLFVYGIDMDWSSGIPENLQSLNVLSFETFGGKEPIVDLKELIHLRYLRIFCPISIRIEEFKQLKYLFCRDGVELQVDREGPKNVLQNLRSLCYVCPDSALETLIKNGCFPNLKKLGLVLYSEDEQGRTKELRRLCGLSNLCYLKLWFNSQKGFSMPALSIDAMEFLSNLTKISLESTWYFNSSNMAILGRIANLQILKLKKHILEAKTLSCGDAGSFPKLQVFLMIYMTSLKRLTLEEGVMPCLQRVVISFCPRLEGIPKRLLSLSNLRRRKEADNNERRRLQHSHTCSNTYISLTENYSI